jgi:hypothetical protein
MGRNVERDAARQYEQPRDVGESGREALIERILVAARRPMPSIVECVQILCTDGVWRGVFSVHGGHTATDQSRIGGYAFQDPRTGCTYGQRESTREALEARHAAWKAEQEADFRSHLESATDARLVQLAAFWLKNAKGAAHGS